jgi:hypothetical protein
MSIDPVTKLDRSPLQEMMRPCWKTLKGTTCCPPGSMMVPVKTIEWCGWSISSPRPSLEQGEWNLSPLSCSLGFVFSKPSKLCAQEPNSQMQ